MKNFGMLLRISEHNPLILIHGDFLKLKVRIIIYTFLDNRDL
jgi:hypothetical protein